jgi:hypothetical protein
MEEIQTLASSFSDWSGQLIVAIAKDRLPPDFQSATYPHLPARSVLFMILKINYNRPLARL